jgi:ATP-dependent Clp protease ATP-binding subunit ClpC
VFERFTDRARRVLVLAQEEARLLHHDFIGTEHILLGLVGAGVGLGARALAELGISLPAVRAAVEETIGPAGSEPMGSPPFTPRAKKVLELSLREALQLGHNYIGTEHMLLGLVREGSGVAAQVLVGLGAELSRVRQEVIKLISGYQAVEGTPLAATTPGMAGGLPEPAAWLVAQQYVFVLEQVGRRPDEYRIAFSALGEWLAARGKSLEELTSHDVLVESVGDGEAAGLRLSVRRGWLAE